MISYMTSGLYQHRLMVSKWRNLFLMFFSFQSMWNLNYCPSCSLLSLFFSPPPSSSLRCFFCRNFSVLEVLRDEEFAPLKNGIDSLTDSPVTVRQALMNLHLKYITRAGGIVTDENNTIIQPQ